MEPVVICKISSANLFSDVHLIDLLYSLEMKNLCHPESCGNWKLEFIGLQTFFLLLLLHKIWPTLSTLNRERGRRGLINKENKYRREEKRTFYRLRGLDWNDGQLFIAMGWLMVEGTVPEESKCSEDKWKHSENANVRNLTIFGGHLFYIHHKEWFINLDL